MGRNTHVLPNWKHSWYRLKILLTLLLVVYLLSGCNSTPSKQIYENSEFGIRLEKPGNWSLNFYERAGRIALKAEDGMPNKGMAYIEIYGNACLRLGPDSLGPEDVIKSHILRIQHLYDLDSVTIVQEPAKVETGELEVTKAIIAIPTMALQVDPLRNQMGDPGPDIFQTIEISDSLPMECC
jgi:hypothetical protein